MWRVTGVCLCALFSVVLASMAVLPLEPKPYKYRSLPGCYIKSLDKVLAVGRSLPAPAPACIQFTCELDAVSIKGCPPVQKIKGCKLIQRINQVYPHCCPVCACL